MADDLRMALTNLLRNSEVDGDVDFLRDGVRILGQTLMDLEVSQHLRAEKNERTPERAGHRNGYRTRQWDTRVGTVELQVPRVRDGSFFPGCSSRAGGRNGLFWASSRKRTSRAFSPAGWTSS